MTRFSFSAALLGLSFLALTARGQQTIQYPYNPDVDNDEYIATSDLTGFLAQFGQDFQPAPVLIDSVDLLSVIQMMQAQITALQSQVASLEASAVPGLGDYVSVDDSAHTVLVSGANLQVVNGAPSADGYSNTTNGKGNLILGYNSQGVDTTFARTGSHCLVMGRANDYNGIYSIVQGLESSVNGNYSAAIAGYQNVIFANSSAIVGGVVNQIAGGACYQSVIIGGESNAIGSADQDSRLSVVVGGRFNKVSSGYTSAIFGGSSNDIEAPTTEVVGNVWNRSIFGGGDNLNIGAGYTSIFGGGGNVLAPRQVPSTGSADNIIGKVGATFLGSVNAQGGELVDSTNGLGED